MITVGFDFGTHQTKVCVENRDGAVTCYRFFKFKDCKGREQFTLPSIILIDDKNRLSYGYIPKESNGRIIRYFKQGAFTQVEGLNKHESIYYSIWYIAYILFLLEEEYAQGFTLQMGVPTDGPRYDCQKELAVSIVLSAYHLVEDVFRNDKDKFMACTLTELKQCTPIIPFDEQKKEDMCILVFPEAYACLKPLVQQEKLDGGMSLMIDIGGGTTDISFFTLEYTDKEHNKAINDRLHVYDFFSINKGLNYLTNANPSDMDRKDSNVLRASEIKEERMDNLDDEIDAIRNDLVTRLKYEFRRQSTIPEQRLIDALKNRPLIYTGGGSRFPKLRKRYGDFMDVIPISEREWRSELIDDIDRISSKGLCPILSTAYGLSISMTNDHITRDKFKDIFKGVREAESMNQPQNSVHEPRADYYLDYEASK